MAETSLTWPETVPWRFRREGFTAPFGDARQRAEASAGPGRLSRRMSVVTRAVSGQIDMLPQEFARLEMFWDADTAGGVLPFWFRSALRSGLPLVSGAAALPLLTAAGQPILISQWLLCQFGDPPSPALIAGGRIRVAISLLVLP